MGCTNSVSYSIPVIFTGTPSGTAVAEMAQYSPRTKTFPRGERGGRGYADLSDHSCTGSNHSPAKRAHDQGGSDLSIRMLFCSYLTLESTQ